MHKFYRLYKNIIFVFFTFCNIMLKYDVYFVLNNGSEGGYFMQIQELADYTAQILLEYYENRIQPFLDACDEDVLWIGPAVGQVIRTKEALVAAFAAEKTRTAFCRPQPDCNFTSDRKQSCYEYSSFLSRRYLLAGWKLRPRLSTDRLYLGIPQ